MFVSRMKGIFSSSKGMSKKSPHPVEYAEDLPVKHVETIDAFVAEKSNDVETELLRTQLAEAQAQNLQLLQTIEDQKNVKPVEVIKPVEVEKIVEVVRVVEKLVTVVCTDLTHSEAEDLNLKLLGEVVQKNQRLADILSKASAESKACQLAIENAAKAHDIEVLMAASGKSADELIALYGIENILNACQEWVNANASSIN